MGSRISAIVLNVRLVMAPDSKRGLCLAVGVVLLAVVVGVVVFGLIDLAMGQEPYALDYTVAGAI